MPPSSSPLPWLMLSLALACGRFAIAETPAGADAVGPSSRAADRDPSAYQPAAPMTAANEGRRLQLGSSADRASKSTRAAGERGNNMLRDWARGSGATAAAALAFVVGLFMLLAWFVKRGMPKSSQVVPSEAIRLLGRVPLGSRQFGQLLHLGNKLVLVHVTQAGVEKLAEIDDPQEVVRLLAICSKNSSQGSQKEFEDIFGQFAKEKTEPGFLEGEMQSGGRRYA